MTVKSKVIHPRNMLFAFSFHFRLSKPCSNVYYFHMVAFSFVSISSWSMSKSREVGFNNKYERLGRKTYCVQSHRRMGSYEVGIGNCCVNNTAVRFRIKFVFLDGNRLSPTRSWDVYQQMSSLGFNIRSCGITQHYIHYTQYSVYLRVKSLSPPRPTSASSLLLPRSHSSFKNPL